MSTALYRRYRPQTFEEVIGQEHVTQPLQAALKSGRINHAYLFSGPRGCGKTTSARILARCLNCVEGPTDTPCGKCPSCVELATGGPGSLDVVEIDAASHNGVDDARDLRERASFAPVRDRYKVFILDEAHMVTPQGFNALLKLVEEPPPHIKFVFATTEPDKVLGTIRSRTHHYPFRLVPPDTMGKYLNQLCESENIHVEDGVLPLVMRAGGGSVRDSLSVLDQLMAGAEEGTVTYQRAVSLLGFTDEGLMEATINALAERNGPQAFQAVESLVGSGHDPRRFVEDLLQRLRDLVILAVAGERADSIFAALPSDQLELMKRQAAAFGGARLSRAADLTAEAFTTMNGATSPRLLLELLLARILMATGASPSPAVQLGQGEAAGTAEARVAGAPVSGGSVASAAGGAGSGAGATSAPGNASAAAQASGAAPAAGGAGATGGNSAMHQVLAMTGRMSAQEAPKEMEPAAPAPAPAQEPATEAKPSESAAPQVPETKIEEAEETPSSPQVEAIAQATKESTVATPEEIVEEQAESETAAEPVTLESDPEANPAGPADVKDEQEEPEVEAPSATAAPEAPAAPEVPASPAPSETPEQPAEQGNESAASPATPEPAAPAVPPTPADRRKELAAAWDQIRATAENKSRLLLQFIDQCLRPGPLAGDGFQYLIIQSEGQIEMANRRYLPDLVPIIENQLQHPVKIRVATENQVAQLVSDAMAAPEAATPKATTPEPAAPAGGPQASAPEAPKKAEGFAAPETRAATPEPAAPVTPPQPEIPEDDPFLDGWGPVAVPGQGLHANPEPAQNQVETPAQNQAQSQSPAAAETTAEAQSGLAAEPEQEAETNKAASQDAASETAWEAVAPAAATPGTEPAEPEEPQDADAYCDFDDDEDEEPVTPAPATSAAPTGSLGTTNPAAPNTAAPAFGTVASLSGSAGSELSWKERIEQTARQIETIHQQQEAQDFTFDDADMPSEFDEEYTGETELAGVKVVAEVLGATVIKESIEG
ncbi:DNA polymerase III, subunit gamma and tau [Boudabousia liubingyangii]|uniref:DNA-directed DNA polymerase n=1 Tax=Boudabousia liubingyangii TaxID=1921764 RepID=A0A1Q5PK62_9ACTO|nr:DNA polymerase III subunit gamma and tau [Boudabousia liubingyangii]OKL46603.1 DNA polymerase III, subunit gamma and tau [Boudabousia liubingyangii]